MPQHSEARGEYGKLIRVHRPGSNYQAKTIAATNVSIHFFYNLCHTLPQTGHTDTVCNIIPYINKARSQALFWLYEVESVLEGVPGFAKYLLRSDGKKSHVVVLGRA